MWSGVEPMEGMINTTYVDILKNITKEFEQLGIYVLLDMHQDVLWAAGPNEDSGIFQYDTIENDTFQIYISIQNKAIGEFQNGSRTNWHHQIIFTHGL
jgi:hypothetical protein